MYSPHSFFCFSSRPEAFSLHLRNVCFGRITPLSDITKVGINNCRSDASSNSLWSQCSPVYCRVFEMEIQAWLVVRETLSRNPKCSCNLFFIVLPPKKTVLSNLIKCLCKQSTSVCDGKRQLSTSSFDCALGMNRWTCFVVRQLANRILCLH